MSEPPRAGDPARGSLRAAAFAGVRWTSASALVGVIAGVVQPLVLVRLLDPSDFGLMAAVVVVVGFTQGFSDVGLGVAIQVRKRVSHEELASVFWLTACMGGLLAAALFAAAPAIADFYGEPGVEQLARWAALAFVLAPLGSVPHALLARNLRFQVIARAEIAGALGGMTVAIASAALGAGALALVWGWLAGIAIRNVLFSLGGRGLGWRPRMRFRRSDIAGYASFGLYEMGTRSINYLAANIDYVVIGRVLGAEALGIYSIAYQLAIRPLMQLNPVITRVATPVFARRQDDDPALARGLAEVTRMIALVSGPLLVGLAVVAPAFVPVVLGERWEDSVPLLQILAFVGLLKALGNPIGSVFLAKNRPDIGFKINVVALPLLTGLFLLVVDRGAEAVAWAYLGFAIVTGLLVTPLIMGRVIGFGARRYVAVLARPALFTSALALVAGATFVGLSEVAGAADGVVLAASAAAGAVVYLGSLLRFERAFLVDTLRQLAGRGRPAPDAPAEPRPA